jgi:hypothetical protein
MLHGGQVEGFTSKFNTGGFRKAAASLQLLGEFGLAIFG